MKKNQLILGVVVLVALVALGMYAQHKNPIDWHTVWEQLTKADWWRIAMGLGCIYLAYLFRSFRWAFLLRHNKKVHPFALLGTQVIGFTGVALIGRVADPVRPYLVSKKTGLPLSNQIAVYIVERLFDAGTMALIFSIAMLWVPTDEILRATSHSGAAFKLGAEHPFWSSFLARYSGLLLTAFGALFLVLVRLSGEFVAEFFRRSFGIVSKKLGESIAQKILAFRAGLDTMRSLADLAGVFGLSLAMWLLIAMAYLLTMRAFVADPVLSAMSPAKCVLMMVISGVSSIVQLPVVGWFTQIFIVKEAISRVLHVSQESSIACAATLLLTTFLGVVPIGLIWAQVDHVSLRKVAAESEQAEENLQPAEAE
ncbi:MAG TPA: lysylphosphatidylglycerol synthase transmembrane domain-containing protein [Terracidiphilus sp.]|nr:lysylphosphatidylglycerol synthase transmembrane domain-containing protein [Terracidiphilus sp.]